MINSGLDPIVITLTDELMLYVMAVISEDVSCYTDLVAISLILIVKIFFFFDNYNLKGEIIQEEGVETNKSYSDIYSQQPS